jgi:hypothetical protein
VNVQQLSDLFEIQFLKARYFRLMDLRRWDEWRDVFTDDFSLFVENTPEPASTEPTFRSADELVEYLRRADPGKITVHQGHMPEIEFVDDDTATGIWAMYDWVDDPGRGGAWQGHGHYHERYRRCDDGAWRIAETRLTRLRLSTVPPQPGNVTGGIDRAQLDALRDRS